MSLSYASEHNQAHLSQSTSSKERDRHTLKYLFVDQLVMKEKIQQLTIMSLWYFQCHEVV